MLLLFCYLRYLSAEKEHQLANEDFISDLSVKLSVF